MTAGKNAPQPPSYRIELWTWRLDLPPSQTAAASVLLSGAETARAARFVHARDRNRYIAGRARVREILGGYLGLPPANVDLREDAYKKPFVPPHVDKPPLHFNLAHSHDFAVLAVSREVPLGVDVELIRPITERVESFFSPVEQAALAALPAADQWRGFYQCWTRKEAFVKALGRGLFIPLEDFDVTLAPGEPPRLLRFAEEPDAPQRWALRHLEFHSGLIGALALPAGAGAIDLISRS